MVGFSTGGGGGGVLGLPPQAAKANVPAKTSTLGKGERGDGRVKLEVRSPKLEAKSVADHADRPSLGFELRTSHFELPTSNFSLPYCPHFTSTTFVRWSMVRMSGYNRAGVESITPNVSPGFGDQERNGSQL